MNRKSQIYSYQVKNGMTSFTEELKQSAKIKTKNATDFKEKRKKQGVFFSF